MYYVPTMYVCTYVGNIIMMMMVLELLEWTSNVVEFEASHVTGKQFFHYLTYHIANSPSSVEHRFSVSKYSEQLPWCVVINVDIVCSTLPSTHIITDRQSSKHYLPPNTCCHNNYNYISTFVESFQMFCAYLLGYSSPPALQPPTVVYVIHYTVTL